MNSFNYTIIISSLGVSWLLIGRLISDLRYFSKLQKTLTLLSVFLIAFLMFTSSNESFLVDYYNLTALRTDDIKIQHLSLTEPITYILFIFLSIGYNSKLNWLFILLFVSIFFSLGGRTAFFCALMTIFLYGLIDSNILVYSFKSVIFLILSFALFSLATFTDNIFFDKLFFKDGVGSDESYNDRIEFMMDFFDGFLGQIVIGNPNFLIYKHNNLGSYSHNILSAFQFYGLFTFSLLIYTICFIIKKIVQNKIYYSKNSLDVFGILMLIYVILSMVTGKSIGFSPFWFIIGFWLFRLNGLREEGRYN